MAVNEIRYKGVSYATDDDIKVPSGVLYEAKALRSDSLEANSLTVTVFSDDKAIMGFAKNDKVEYFRNGHRVGVYYLQTVERVGSDAYTLSALSALGRLITMRHAGGIYTGQTVAEVVPQICGPVPVMIESVYASRKLYGYLPYSNPDTKTGNGQSARDNLSQVLFAIGAALGTDEDGVMRVEKLWDGVSCAITADQINEDSCSTVYETPVSAVEVTEHQWVQNQDETTLFEGTAEEGTLVTFDDPAHDLTAEGFTITEQGDNYAVLSAGSGTLTGKGYTHLTRIVRRTVTEGAEENVVAITDATLVSLTNSVDVANRMADYYSHRETIQVDVEPGAEHAGSVVQIYHPWDKKMVQACVESRETVISGILNSQTRALVGFAPQQPDTAEYFDERVLLTGSGTWTVPEGVSEIRAVLIGGGYDGAPGSDGGISYYGTRDDKDTSKTIRITVQSTNSISINASARGGSKGEGGTGGTGGAGGKILSLSLNVQPGHQFDFSAGAANGGDSAFGEYSSASGEQSSAGYYDIVGKKFYARSGVDGANGGDGGSPGEYGDSVGDVSGGHGISGDSDSQTKTGSSASTNATLNATGTIGGSGGGGAGGNSGSQKGQAGYASERESFNASVQITEGSGGPNYDYLQLPSGSIYLSAPVGGFGGNGADGADGENYGDGANGGGGGGGAGAASTSSVSATLTAVNRAPTGKNEYYDVIMSLHAVARHTVSRDSTGGKGGSGGKGVGGCIILYYRRPKIITPGPLVTSDGKWLLDSLGRRIIV